MSQITRDEFAIWLESPVTQLVMAGLTRLAGQAVEQWKDAAWLGQSDPETHARVVGRVDAYQGFTEMTYENVMGANGLEIEE